MTNEKLATIQWGLRVAILLCLVSVPMAMAVVQTKVRFSQTAAAQAFAAKQFEKALEEFQKLRAANPNNALILRYLAITLDRLGRHDEAIDIFKEALAIQPNNVALNYHLGVTYYNSRRGDAAVAVFRRVLQLAPQSQYAEYATRYLDAIAQQRTQQQKTGAPKRFGVYVQGSLQYDDNVLSAARRDNRLDDTRFSGYLSLEYYLYRSPKWQVTAEGNGYRVWYDDQQFEGLDISQYGGNLRAQRVGTLGKYPYVTSLKYDYSETHLSGGDTYSRTHGATAGLRMNFTRNTATYAHYRYTNDDFTEEGFDPAFSSRDADNHEVGLRHTWFFADRQGQVSAHVEFQKNNAKGVNFQYDGPSGGVGVVVPLPWQLRAELNATYGKADYDKFAGPVPRETKRKRFSAGLSRWFGRRFLIRLDYSYLDEDSSYGQLAYKREVIGASASYVY